VRLAAKKQKQAKKTRDTLMAEKLKDIGLEKAMSPAEKKAHELKKEQKEKEFSARMANLVHQHELELPKNSTAHSTLMNRCILMMGTMLHVPAAARRLVDAGGLGLVEACLDVHIEDIYGAAANFIGNLSVSAPDLVNANNFKDPKHVIEGICRTMNDVITSASPADRRAGPNKSGMVLMRALTIIRKKDGWIRYFDEAIEEGDEGIGQFLEMMFDATRRARVPGFSGEGPTAAAAAATAAVVIDPRGGGSGGDRAARASAQGLAPRVYSGERDDGIDASVGTLTGELRPCSCCGKIESFKREWKACSGCKLEHYCGRDCQVAAWKAGHKRACQAKE
jgi:hypothetical protein